MKRLKKFSFVHSCLNTKFQILACPSRNGDKNNKIVRPPPPPQKKMFKRGFWRYCERMQRKIVLGLFTNLYLTHEDYYFLISKTKEIGVEA
jgi:hypothetical protein